MANGHAVALPLAEEPEQEGIEATLGEVVAAAACVIAQAVEDCRQGGSLAPATRAAGGDRLARVTMLALDHELGDEDFFSKARAAGKKNLRERLNGSSISPGAADAVLEFYLDSLFEITSCVMRDERAFRRAMGAN